MNRPEGPLAILGAGSWGTALALLIARRNESVLLWDHNPKQVAALIRDGRNSKYLPEFAFNSHIKPEVNLSSIIEKTSRFIIAVPSHAFRATLIELKRSNLDLDRSCYFCWGTKGLEARTGKLLNEVFEDVIGKDVLRTVVSGPSFAHEVAAHLPTALTIAGGIPEDTGHIAKWFRNDRTRVYTSEDIVGVQLGGATKNVMAIAAGISDGLGFGSNARAAIVSRGLSEMVRLGIRLGGQIETFYGLAGVGDLVLTCTDNRSRNRRVGLGIGAGKSLVDVLHELGQEAEGVDTACALYKKSCELGVEMPITEQIYRVLSEGIDPAGAVKTLLDREPRAEIEQPGDL